MERREKYVLDNIVILGKLTPRNSNEVPKQSGERAGEAHVKQTHQYSESKRRVLHPTPLLGIFLMQSCGVTALVRQAYQETGPLVFGYRALHRRSWRVW